MRAMQPDPDHLVSVPRPPPRVRSDQAVTLDDAKNVVSVSSIAVGACSATQWPAPGMTAVCTPGAAGTHPVGDMVAPAVHAADPENRDGQRGLLALHVLRQVRVPGAVETEAGAQGVPVAGVQLDVVVDGVVRQRRPAALDRSTRSGSRRSRCS